MAPGRLIKENSPPIVGLAGPIGSGKTSLAEFLRDKHGFGYVRYSQVLKDKLRDKGKPITRETLQEFGEEIFRTIGGKGLTELVIERIPADRPTVVDGIRHLDDADTLRMVFGDRFTLVYLDSSAADRFHRLNTRDELGRMSQDEFERISRHPVEAEVALLRTRANLVIRNSNGCPWPEEAVDRILANLRVTRRAICL
jgi:dephospho-CoA kinase